MRRTAASSKTCFIDRGLFLLGLACCWAWACPAGATPQVDTVLSTGASVVGCREPITLTISVSWQGDPEACVVEPPEIIVPEGLTVAGSATATETTHAGQKIDFRFTLQAEAPGIYTIQPVPLRYWPRGAAQARSLVTEAVSFQAATVPLLYSPALLPAAILAGAGVLIAAAVFIFRRRRTRAHTRAATAPAPPAAEELQACRRCLLEGDAAGFCARARRMLEHCPGDHSALQARLERQEELLRFGGRPPDRPELERAWRELARATNVQ